ncbi:MAG: hypothetical protein FJ020_02465 [Chloroflexi bacterium]|nr:hypothetical protein [Chloroflexota bacterium]
MTDDAELLGKSILVGITYLDRTDKLERQEQFFGTITDVSDSWIEVKPERGSRRHIPNELILDAPQGKYECVSTGEIIRNPDFLASWIVKPGEYPDSPKLCTPNYAPLVDPSVPEEWKVTYSHDPAHLNHVIETKGSQYLGKHVLLGLTYERRVGRRCEQTRKEMVHGWISRVSFKEGVVISLSDGRERALPPELLMFQPASPGDYVLTANGERISDVDLVTRWIITEKNDDSLDLDTERESGRQ